MVYQCGLRLAERFKSGGPSLGRSPGAHKQRRPANQDQIQIFGKIGSTQFLEQGESPAFFFVGAAGFPFETLVAGILARLSLTTQRTRWRRLIRSITVSNWPPNVAR